MKTSVLLFAVSMSLIVCAWGFLPVSAVLAQESAGFVSGQPAGQAVVPPYVRYGGVAANRAGDTVEGVFRVYATKDGDEPLWSEVQRVQVSADGKYSVLLGSATEGGVPAAVFHGGAGRWLGVSFERAPENGRTPLVSVAYAIKAGDAETVGGISAASLVTQSQLAAVARTLAAQAAAVAGPAPQVTSPTGAGTQNHLPLWTGAATLGDSAIYQGGTAAAPQVGVNTTSPSATLEVRGTGIFRSDLALSTGSSATAAKGMSSPMLKLFASSFQSGAAKPVMQTFAWQAAAVSNNTASPSAS